MTRFYLATTDYQSPKSIRFMMIMQCDGKKCEHEISDVNYYCYKATVYETSKLIAEKLNIPKDKYEVSFQSRLTNNWLEPFSDEVLKSYPAKGIKKVLVFSPAFTADCLETSN